MLSSRARPALAVLLLLLTVAPVAAAERDPGYQAILDAYKARRHDDVVRLAPLFLEEKPDHAYAHSVRYMKARSLELSGRLPESVEAYRDYVRRHPDAKYADRCRAAVVRALNADLRAELALKEAEAYLAAFPDGPSASRVAYERGYALESLRRFPEAAAAYRAVRGSSAELAAFRVGVALFRGRSFDESAAALRAFLETHPASKRRASAEDYLFRCDTGFEDIRDGIVRDYTGKYEDDPRLVSIRESLAARRRAALGRIEKAVGLRPPETFLIRLADAGSDRSGNFARTRIEVIDGAPRHVVVLLTEPLLLGTFDLDRTLTHELYHCLQRERLGEDHFRAQKWVREGTALHVAGQGESRARLLAAEVGRRRNVADPMRRLVDGLGGRHAFEDYAESVAAFDAAEARHGKARTVRLLRRLLDTTDVAAAVREVLGESMAEFEAGAEARARARLEPLVREGRAGLLAAIARAGARDWKGMLAALPEEPGVYAPVVVYYRALARYELGRHADALRTIREEYFPRHRRFAPMTDNAVFLEVRCLAALESDGFEEVADRAARDLEPTGAFRAFRKFLNERTSSGETD